MTTVLRLDLALCLAASIPFASCAAVNFGLVVGAHQRLNAHASRIIRLEGDLLAATPGGQAMIEAKGCPDITIKLSDLPPDPRRGTSTYSPRGVTAYMAPNHVYSGGILGTLVGGDDEAKLPEHLLSLVRVNSSKNGQVVFHNVPDGVYQIVIQHYGEQANNVGTKTTKTSGLFIAEDASVAGGAIGTMTFDKITRGELLGISDTKQDREVQRYRQEPANKQNWKNRTYNIK